MKRAIFAVLLLGAASGANARSLAPGAGSDPRVQSVDYDPSQIVTLRGAPGYQLMIALAPDEQVKSIALGDSSAWQVSVAKGGDRLFLKPVEAGRSTNMTVITSIRTYAFELDSLPRGEPDLTYSLSFRYPPRGPSAGGAGDFPYVDVSAATRRLTKYRVSGDPEVRPQSVTDDGTHTFVSWPAAAAIPATYAIDASGKEQLANGMMGSDDVYVIDGVPRQLVFRIDRAVAHAERVFPRRTR